MDCLAFFFFALLVATFGNGLPVQGATTLKKSTSSLSIRSVKDTPDSSGLLVRRAKEYTRGDRSYPDKENPYLYIESGPPPPQISDNIIGILKRVLVTEPAKIYTKAYRTHVKDGKWRETIKKGKNAIVRLGLGRKSKKEEPASSHLSSKPTAARYQVPPPSTYSGFYAPAARHDISTFRNRRAPAVPLENPYVTHPNPNFAPSAPFIDDPDLPPFQHLRRRSEIDRDPSPYVYHTPSSPPKSSGRQIEHDLKGFGKKMLRKSQKVYQERIKGNHLRETLEVGKEKAKEALGKVAERNHAWATKFDQRFNKEEGHIVEQANGPQSSSSGHSTSFPRHAQYAPSAPPFEPSTPRFAHSPPRPGHRA